MPTSSSLARISAVAAFCLDTPSLLGCPTRRRARPLSVPFPPLVKVGLTHGTVSPTQFSSGRVRGQKEMQYSRLRGYRHQTRCLFRPSPGAHFRLVPEVARHKRAAARLPLRNWFPAEMSAAPRPSGRRQRSPGGTQAQATGTPLQAVPLAQQASAPRAVAPAHPPPPPPIDGAAPVGDMDDDSQFDDSSSVAGTDAQADTDLSARPYQEILQIISEFHPEMILKQDAPASVTSSFGARLSAATELAPTLKAVQSPLITSSVEAITAQLRGPSSATCASSGLTTSPSGAKPGKFVKPRAPSFLKDGFTEGSSLPLPPPTAPSDLAVTSASPGQTASVSVAQLMTLENSVLYALDLASLGDLSASALAYAIS